jgi:SAM-dependent methyltransferase
MNEDIKINDDIFLSGKNGNGFKMIISNNQPHLGGNYIGQYEHEGIKYMGDGNSITIEMWKYLINKYKIETVLDVGCGCGYSSAIFKSLGCDVTAFDGLEYNIQNSDPSLNCFIHDITKSPYISEKIFDLVWCCEVAEHVEEKYIENLLTTLKNGKIIAMTAARPGDGGHHHVNCQSFQYWIDKICEDKKYFYDEEETFTCKNLSNVPDQRWTAHFKRNGLVFKYQN